MDVNRLYEILNDCTVQLRKGEAVQQRTVGSLAVTEVFAMPHEFEVTGELEKVDLHFITVGVEKAAAERHRAELMSILETYPEPERLAGGPSYIEVAAAVGDQGAALQLFALGYTLGLWTIITPERLGISGAEATEMAGRGLVMITGFTALGAIA